MCGKPSFCIQRGVLCVFQYLALGGSHLCEQGLGDFGPLHFLLDLIVDGGVDVEDAALRLAVPLAGQRRRFHLVTRVKTKQIYGNPAQNHTHFPFKTLILCQIMNSPLYFIWLCA